MVEWGWLSGLWSGVVEWMVEWGGGADGGVGWLSGWWSGVVEWMVEWGWLSG